MLPIGKLESKLLKSLIFDQLKMRRPEVLVRPGLGEDCAVIDGKGLCVLSTDPITGTEENIGKLAVHINCNDIAAQGAAPLGLMLTILAPRGTEAKQIEKIMNQAAQEAEKLDVEIIGGHTEITSAVNRVVISGVAIGFKPQGNEAAKQTRIGDLIVMTKSAGLEGAGILAANRALELSEVLKQSEMEIARGFLDQISVVQEGILAGEYQAVKLHDVTEGGLYGAIWEICESAQVGCLIQQDKIVVDPVTSKICTHYKIDPYRLISSGSMLVILAPYQAGHYIEALHAKGIQGTVIGEVTEGKILKKTSEGITGIAPPEGDELYKIVG